MKKSIIITILSLTICFSAFAQDSIVKEEYKSDLTYVNVQVFRAYDQKQAYVVMYQKNNNKIGQVLLPKSWFHSVDGEPKKGILRTLPKLISPYMTVIYKNNEFHKVLLNMPLKRDDPAWSVIVPDMDLSNKLNTETLEIAY